MTEIHIGSIERRMPGNTCPACGKTADGGTSLDDKSAVRMPKPGDYAVCLYCAALNVYDHDLRLRPPTRAERRRVSRDPRLSQLVQIAADTAQRRRQSIQ
jgi:hypothetical protein